MNGPMNVGNIHSHAEGLGRHQYVDLAFSKVLQHLLPSGCRQSSVKIVNLSTAYASKFKPQLLGVFAPGDKDDDGATLICLTLVGLSQLDSIHNLWKSKRQHLLEKSKGIDAAQDANRLHLNVRTQGLYKTIRPICKGNRQLVRLYHAIHQTL